MACFRARALGRRTLRRGQSGERRDYPSCFDDDKLPPPFPYSAWDKVGVQREGRTLAVKEIFLFGSIQCNRQTLWRARRPRTSL